MTYLKIALSLLFVSVLCTSGRAQSPLPQPLSEGERSSNSTHIYLLARPHGDSITLRWAPADYSTWTLLRQYGAILERKRIGTDRDFVPVGGERRIALSLEDIKAFADTTNVHVIAVAEALYGEATPGTNTGPLGTAKDIHEEQSQRLFLALINADLSAAAAEVLGWRFVDRAVDKGQTYDYRLRIPQPEAPLTTQLRTRSDANFYAGPVLGLTAREEEHKVVLRWPTTINDTSFFAYRLEVSEDGNRWNDLLTTPLVAEATDDFFEHSIKLEANYQARHYRLRGINSFAETGPPSAPVRAQGVDRTPPPKPPAIQGEDLRNGTNMLRWETRDPAPDLAGYRVLRGLSIRGKMAVVTPDVLPVSKQEWTDPAPFADRNNYYALEAIDTSGNVTRGPVNFVQRFDDTPPATPIGLTGRIDTMGRVYLMWEAGTESDLLGYRVYRSHAENREFLQITQEVQHRNFYFDSTTLETITEEILYRVVAVDKHYNPSPYSATLSLKRPDKIAPAAPSISGYSAQGESVVLHIRPSKSGDVVRQTVWRATAEGKAQPLAAIGAKDTVFVDTTTAVRTNYVYTIRAEDEVGLAGESNPLQLRSGMVSARTGVSNLARTQVPGTDKEVLRWVAPAVTVSGYQLYGGQQAGQLRPLRRLAAATTEWPLPQAAHYYALRVIYADGSRSALSEVLKPTGK